MPHVDAAMAASIRGVMQSRNIVDTANGVKTSLSSWDGCMNASYCKWPVIAAIVVASLIVLSVIACIVRCACCGMSCCCECFSCLKCCGNCCGCCDPPGGRKHKHLDDQKYPPPNQGYHPQPPMMAGSVGAYEPSKYAHFETGPTGHALEPKTVSDDALPPMPSWDTAAKKKILVEEPGAVELGELDPKTGQNMPLMSGAASPGAISPVHTPYGDRPGMHDQNSYMSGASAAAVGAGALGAGAGAIAMGGRGNGLGPYGQNGPNGSRSFNNAPKDPRGEPGQAFSPVNDPGRGQNYGDQFPQGPGQPGQPGNNYGPPANSYGPPANSYGPPGVAAGGTYGNRPPPQRQYSNGGQRPLMPPQRQYSNDSQRPLMHAPSPTRPYPADGLASMSFPGEPPSAPYRGPARMASPPEHDHGFDFGSNHTPNPVAMPMPFAGDGGRRPNGGGPGIYPGSTAPPSYASRSPPPREQYGGGGNGYEAYSAPGERTRPPGSAGRGRQAEGWEVV